MRRSLAAVAVVAILTACGDSGVPAQGPGTATNVPTTVSTGELTREFAGELLKPLSLKRETETVSTAPIDVMYFVRPPSDEQVERIARTFGDYVNYNNDAFRKLPQYLGDLKTIDTFRALMLLGVYSSATVDRALGANSSVKLVAQPTLSEDFADVCYENSVPETCRIIVGHWQLKTVTGIRAGSENGKVVEYTVEFVPTAEGKKYFYYEEKTETRAATFFLYDDGWRLAE